MYTIIKNILYIQNLCNWYPHLIAYDLLNIDLSV